jgi:cell division protein FtsW
MPLIGVVGFQPSEFAKLAMIIYLAVLLEKSVLKKEGAFMVLAVVTGFTAALILLQPNMSTAALIFLIGISMYFVSGANLAPLFLFGPFLFLSGLGFILSSEYRKVRLLTFLNPIESGDLSLGYHIKQILIALGSGGLFGLGFGQSRQKFQYLPEVASDSIFAIIGEEFGFIGTTLLVLLFTVLIYKGFMIAKDANTLLGKLLATGITTWIAFQFFVNVGAMLHIIPLTGIPLPLVSYGGSSLVFSLMGLGLLANISAHSS